MKKTGVICALLSALIYGIAPIFSKMTFAWGNNGMNLAFWRATLSLPLLLVLALRGGFSLPRHAVKDVLLCGLMQAATALTLNGSYGYVAVGTATVLHFVYPLLVAVMCAVLYKQRLGIRKTVALCACMVGVAFFFDTKQPGNTTGVLLALTSGVTFAGYILCLNRPTLRDMPTFQFSLLMSTIVAVVAGVFSASTGQLTVALPPMAWVILAFVSVATMVGALTLFQLGIRWAGAVETSMLSLLEPIASMVFGLIILGDSLSWTKMTGCAIILSSLFFITLNEMRGRRVQGEEAPGA